MNPLISIVSPVFQGEDYLPETIASVLEQTYTNWEWILIDDASSDNSYSILQELAAEDDRVKVIRLPENSGAAIARNTGTQTAQGKFLAFLDSDDLWTPEKLATQLAFMLDNDVGFSFTSYDFADSAGIPSGKPVKVPATLVYRQALRNTIIWTSTVMIDLEKINRTLCLMPNVRRGQDSLTWWQILRETRQPAFGVQGPPLAFYRDTANSLSSNKLRALKRTWDNYRKVENLDFLSSTVNFVFYVVNAIRRRW